MLELLPPGKIGAIKSGHSLMCQYQYFQVSYVGTLQCPITRVQSSANCKDIVEYNMGQVLL